MGLRSSNRLKTTFIRLDTRKCEACWNCLDACPNQVIGKISFLGHRHAVIQKPDQCIGCLKCVKSCLYNAYTPLF